MIMRVHLQSSVVIQMLAVLSACRRWLRICPPSLLAHRTHPQSRDLRPPSPKPPPPLSQLPSDFRELPAAVLAPIVTVSARSINRQSQVIPLPERTGLPLRVLLPSKLDPMASLSIASYNDCLFKDSPVLAGRTTLCAVGGLCSSCVSSCLLRCIRP